MSDLEQRVRHMLDCSEIANIRTASFSAERVSAAEAADVALQSQTTYACDEGGLAGRYEWTAKLVDSHDDPVANMSIEIIVEFEVHEGYEPDAEAAENIAGTTGYFAAYPYVREFIHSCSTRLQLNPLVLGLLMRDAMKPRTITSPQGVDSAPATEALESSPT